MGIDSRNNASPSSDPHQLSLFFNGSSPDSTRSSCRSVVGNTIRSSVERFLEPPADLFDMDFPSESMQDEPFDRKNAVEILELWGFTSKQIRTLLCVGAENKNMKSEISLGRWILNSPKLSCFEADSLSVFSRVIEHFDDLFSNLEGEIQVTAIKNWFNKNNPYLDSKKPIELIQSEGLKDQLKHISYALHLDLLALKTQG